MHESLRALRDPRLDQAAVLCQLILDIRCILAHPDLQNSVKLAAIAEAVDELAPPPPPDGITGEHVTRLAGVLTGGNRGISPVSGGDAP